MLLLEAHTTKWYCICALIICTVGCSCPMNLLTMLKLTNCPGLAAYDFPLVYLLNDKLNQPIFGCNNLAGSFDCQHLCALSMCM